MHSHSGVDEENEGTLNMRGTLKGPSGIQNSFVFENLFKGDIG